MPRREATCSGSASSAFSKFSAARSLQPWRSRIWPTQPWVTAISDGESESRWWVRMASSTGSASSQAPRRASSAPSPFSAGSDEASTSRALR